MRRLIALHKSSFEKLIALLVVVAVHLISLAVLAGAGDASTDAPLNPPSIQGILLPAPVAEAVAVPSAKVQPVVKKETVKKPKVNKHKKDKKVKPKQALPEEKKIVAKEPVDEPLEEIQEAVEFEPETSTTEIPVALPMEENNSMGAPLTPPQLDANPLINPAPAYPKMSRKLGEHGTVVLEILIRSDGSVGKIKLKISSGYKRLDKTAMTAIKRWRYVPAMRGDEAVEYWYEQALEFNLKE